MLRNISLGRLGTDRDKQQGRNYIPAQNEWAGGAAHLSQMWQWCAPLGLGRSHRAQCLACSASAARICTTPHLRLLFPRCIHLALHRIHVLERMGLPSWAGTAGTAVHAHS